MRDAAKLIVAALAAAGALALLASVHVGVLDAGADVVIVVALLSLSHTAFHLVDDEHATSASGGRRTWRRRGKSPPR